MDPNLQTPIYQPPKKAPAVSTVSLVLAIVSFFCNPFSVLPLAALICGIVGLCIANGRPKGQAIAGIILSIVAGIWQVILDAILGIFTFGLSFLF
ncbi:MAG: hypothetical protein IJY42_03215 [Clostridia bacterium]|nr:hypothetical protein [Clostridia bacterium]